LIEINWDCRFARSSRWSTSRSALRRLAETDDIARMVDYLLGEGGRNITGRVPTVDAGTTA
jgi:3-oxoacyl-[acyl-carrier protein] reductase